MHPRVACAFLCVTVLVTGCASQRTVPSIPQVQSNTPLNPTRVFQTPQSEHPTVAIQTAVATQHTTKLAPEIKIEYTVNIGESLPTEFKGEGSLLGWSNQIGKSYLVLPSFRGDVLPGNFPTLGDFSRFALSPDWKMVAYLDWTQDEQEELLVVTEGGIQVTTPDWPKGDFMVVIDWLGNDRIAVADGYHRDGSVVIYQLSSKDTSTIEPFFPAETKDGGIYPHHLPKVFYNPALTRAVVVRYVEDTPPRRTFELWDSTTHELLWKQSSTALSSQRPEWSPDGKSFSVSLSDYPPSEGDDCGRLLFVSQDGEYRDLMDCSALVSSWSPDGLYIATWQYSSSNSCSVDEHSRRLVIIEVETGNQNILTICSIKELGSIHMTQYPIWSPDNRYIAFNFFDDDSDPINVVVLDIEELHAYLVGDIQEVLGWIH